MRIDTHVQLLINRRTKIVATLGPSSSDADTIGQLVSAGVDVFRLNMSHGTHETHRHTFETVTTVARRQGRPVAVLADLCGPKIRVGAFPDGSIVLENGQSVVVTTREVPGGPGLIPSQYPALAGDVAAGDRILLDDGNLELSVDAVEGADIRCTVTAGGRLKDHKGMNLPGVAVSAPSLTPADREDARFALDLGVDFLALSFVRCAADLEDLRTLVNDAGATTALVAKIEKPEALDNIEEILEAADAVMVARGDLGVELPAQAVPLAQAQIIDLARDYRKPVIVATQMLESMITHPRPTRAEVSDVATAVKSGADAVMLSAETAAGAHPVAAVSMMDDIARQTEGYLWGQGAFGSLTHDHRGDTPLSIEDALSDSVALLSRALRVRAILAVSLRRGRSLAVMSASRPAAPIIGLCPDEATARMAGLLWGVVPVTVSPSDLDDPMALSRKIVTDLGLASPGHTVLVVGGFSRDPSRNTPSVTVVTV